MVKQNDILIGKDKLSIRGETKRLKVAIKPINVLTLQQHHGTFCETLKKAGKKSTLTAKWLMQIKQGRLSTAYT